MTLTNQYVNKANVNTSTVLNDNKIPTGQVPKHCYLRPMILAKVHILLGRRANFKANSNVFVKEFNTKGTWTQEENLHKKENKDLVILQNLLLLILRKLYIQTVFNLRYRYM